MSLVSRPRFENFNLKKKKKQNFTAEKSAGTTFKQGMQMKAIIILTNC